MASFDIVSKVDIQTLDNAINAVKKEVLTRYDFKGSESSIDLDKKSFSVHVVTEDDMKMGQIQDIIISKLVKNNIDPGAMDLGKELYASGKLIKKDIKIRQGLDKEVAKKIVKSIKDAKFKVQPAIMDDQIRVTAKKIDELQAVIAHCRKSEFDVPLQYINFK